jgi:hypothetical protein
MDIFGKPKEWHCETNLDRINNCRVMLLLHGFLSDDESERVKTRILKWRNGQSPPTRPAKPQLRLERSAMGDIADLMLNGLLCRTCGAYIDGDMPGYPRFCAACESEDETESEEAAD